MRAVYVIIGAIALLALPLIILAVVYAVQEDDFDVNATGPSIDSGARIEIERLRQQMEAVQAQLTAVQEQLEVLANRPVPTAQAPSFGTQDDNGFQPDGENAIADNYAQVVLIANRRNVNRGINVAGSRWLENFLGRPRENLSDKCEPMTNPKLRSMLVVDTVGPIRVSMLQPAIDSLKRVFAKVEATDPDLYARINTAGSLCVRQIRGTRGRTSTHSFGLAVDLNIDGKLDTLGDGKTQLGLTILADFFIEEGWAWGAAWGREDSMHFEVSKQMLQQWRKEGKI
ncbi:MAG: M15 family metallopeptidase [Pseudomonadota bacterium]